VSREIIALLSKIQSKHMNTPCGQNIGFLTLNMAVRIVTTGRCKVNKIYNNNKTRPPDR
jgi:hypothetical protein